MQLDPEPEEENFFTMLGKRVRNTFETIDTPKWMQDSSSSTVNGNANTESEASSPLFKRPRWMGGDDSGGSSNLGFGRLFGGSEEDGRVRL